MFDKGNLHIFIVLIISFVLQSCSNESYPVYDSFEDLSPGVISMQKRAELISNTKWNPIKDIVRGKTAYYAGCTYTGIPYSSVKEIDSFVGIEVSDYTFSTAVRNPFSVIYTEDITKEPYHGTNCSLYYGTVCSTTVDYALGIDIPYATNMMDTLSCFIKRDINTPNTVEIGDILLSDGHVVLVTNIKKENDEIRYVQILEASSLGTNAHIKDYSFSDFCMRWNSIGWTSYYYLGLNDIPMPTTEHYGLEIEKRICPNKGDRSCYRITDNIVLDCQDCQAKEIDLYKDGELANTIMLNGTEREISVQVTSEGKYYAILKDNNNEEIDACSFIVVNTDIETEFVDSNKIKVKFPTTSSTPHYIVIVDIHGNRLSLNAISKEDLTNWEKTILIPQVSSCYMKLLFKNEYGQISNTPIKIK